MNIVLRLAAACGLSGLLLVTPVSAESDYGLTQPSTTGAYLAGQLAMKELRTADAAKFFREAATSDWENSEILRRALVALAANGDIEGSAEMARKLLETWPDEAMPHIIVATVAIKQRRYDAALAALDGIGADTFEDITGSILKAWALTGQGKIDDAFTLLDGLAEGALEDFLLFHRAVMADVAGRSEDAIAFAGQAYDSEPFSADVVEAYARMLGNAGRFDEAQKVIAKFETRSAGHPLIQAVKAAIGFKRKPGLFAEDVQAGAGEMFHAVGLAFANEGSLDAGMVFLRLGQYLDPNADVIALVIGNLYDQAEQPEAANAIYSSIGTNSPFRSMAVVRAAGNFEALGDRPEAIRQLRNIVNANPGDIDATETLGNLLRFDKQYEAAADVYTRLLDVTGGASPASWRFYFARGAAYERAKLWPLAEQDFRQALKLNPGQPQILNYLGYSWVDQGINLQEGLKMIEEAVQAAPGDGYIIDSLGWAYFRLGRFDEAVLQLEAAASLQPTDPTINDHLGDAYWEVGRKREARFQWNIALSVDKEGEVRDRVLAKLEGGLDAVPMSGETPEGDITQTEPSAN